MIKVAVIGTHGTRKTTICHQVIAGLKKREINAEYLGEIARNIPAGLYINEATTRESQEWILHEQIAKEIEYSGRKDIDVLVCDRGVIDNYMYYVYRFGSNPALDMLVNSRMKTYAGLFKLPIKKLLLNCDLVRATDPVFQKAIDDLLEKELKERGILFQRYKGLETTINKIIALRR